MPYSYYDIDTILAEEELVPCTTLLTFRHLAFLDPDYLHSSVPLDEPNEDYSADAQQAKRQRGGGSGAGGKKRGRGGPPRHLPEKSLIKMPLWAVDKWANLGFCRVGIPRHFGRSARERLEADPSVADIRSKDERFYKSGNLLVDLIERSAHAKMASSSSSSSARGRRGTSSIDAATASTLREAAEVRRTLVLTYSGERMRRIFDWTLSNIDDDVTNFTRRLTCMEMVLFQKGAAAAAAHSSWKASGSRRIAVSAMALRSAAMGQRAAVLAAAAATTSENGDKDGGARSVTPDQHGGGGGGGRGGGKRMRVH